MKYFGIIFIFADYFWRFLWQNIFIGHIYVVYVFWAFLKDYFGEYSCGIC